MKTQHPIFSNFSLLFLAFLFNISSVGIKQNSTKVVKFMANDTRAYLEIQHDKDLHRVFTEYQKNYMTIIVFDKFWNVEALKLSFVDNKNNSNLLSIEFRQEKTERPFGAAIIEADFIKKLSYNAPEFEAWKLKFTSFPTADPSLTHSGFLLIKPEQGGNTIKVEENGQITYRMSNMFCACQRGAILGVCFNSVTRCAMDNLCDAVKCIEAGYWDSSCQTALDQAMACINAFE